MLIYLKNIKILILFLLFTSNFSCLSLMGQTITPHFFNNDTGFLISNVASSHASLEIDNVFKKLMKVDEGSSFFNDPFINNDHFSYEYMNLDVDFKNIND